MTSMTRDGSKGVEVGAHPQFVKWGWDWGATPSTPQFLHKWEMRGLRGRDFFSG